MIVKQTLGGKGATIPVDLLKLRSLALPDKKGVEYQRLTIGTIHLRVKDVHIQGRLLCRIQASAIRTALCQRAFKGSYGEKNGENE